MGYFIPSSRSQNLRSYSYSGHDGSLLSKYILTPYWNNLVKLFPMWYAPNLITLSGLAFVFVNFLSMIYYEPSLACASKPLHQAVGGSWDPLFDSPAKAVAGKVATTVQSIWHGSTFNIAKTYCPPSWVFFSWSAGLFIYQSLDAIDGKQARRTGSSSPLGEVFDHGCDAINTTLEVLLTAAALNLGMGWWTVASQVFTLANFYLTTWEEYHTGVLFLSSFSGPVEGIIIIVVIFFITGLYGPTFWDQGILTVLSLDHLPVVTQLRIKNLPLNECFLVFGACGLVFNIAGSYTNVYKAARKKGKSVLEPLLGLLPFVVNATANVLWLNASDVIRTKHLLPFAIYWGLSFAYQVGLLICAHVSKGPFPYVHVLLLWSLVGALDANLPRLIPGQRSFVHGTEEQALAFVYASLALAGIMYVFFVSDAISTFCEVLDINCLTIKYYGRPKPKSSFETEPEIPDRAETEKKASGNLRQRGTAVRA